MGQLKIKELKKCNTVSDLNNLGIGQVQYDISHRGGKLYFNSQTVARAIGMSAELLPPKFGVYVNYLGGGVRGSLCVVEFYKVTNKRHYRLLEELANACGRAYLGVEDELCLNETEDEEGEINWDALATQKTRERGITSTY